MKRKEVENKSPCNAGGLTAVITVSLHLLLSGLLDLLQRQS